ncbi:hypothetical protein MRX96_016980 [Rhipicephalus microplus]
MMEATALQLDAAVATAADVKPPLEPSNVAWYHSSGCVHPFLELRNVPPNYKRRSTNIKLASSQTTKKP